MKYAIKYLKIENDDTTILIPKEVVQGNLDREYFETKKEIYAYVTNPILDGKYVIGDAYTLEELKEMYGYETDDQADDVIEMFYLDALDKISAIKNGRRIQVNLFDIFDDDSEKTIYQNIDGEGCLFLNQKIFDILENIEDLQILKDKLREYSDHLANFETDEKYEGIDSIVVKDGHVVEIDKLSNDNYSNNINYNHEDALDTDISSKEFSVTGLYEYLKSRIIGHDEELKDIATILFMNYKSNGYFGTENILIPGPTGTGKTATFNTAAEYFNVPFKNINTINLVPEGIVGTTVEDEFSALIDACQGDIKKAEKAILVFDEFDKLGLDGLDIKTSLTNVFLKVLEGGSFPINRQMRQTRVYNTSLASKICLGTFVEAYKTKKNPLGFNSEEVKKEEFDKNLLVQSGYFTTELLTRFQHFIPYKELTDDDKLRIILESKLSAYLLKKERLESQFNLNIDGDKEFAEGVISMLKEKDQSVRDINNIVAKSFLPIEYEVLSNPEKYKTLTLTRETPSSKKYDLR